MLSDMSDAHEATIFVNGDTARYTGPASRGGGAFIMNGDVVTVTRPNLDEDDDVEVEVEGGRTLVSPYDLEWLAGV
jgi:hypothetical protein